MKNLTKYFIIIFFVFVSCGMSFAADKKDDIKITMTPNIIEDTKSDQTIFSVTSSKSKKTWEFKASEWNKMMKSTLNWEKVSTTDPVIKDVYEDTNYLYIVFGYYDMEQKDFLGIKIGKKEKSILAGKILIHKKYLINSEATKCNVEFYKGATIGLGVYSVILTIVFLIIVL